MNLFPAKGKPINLYSLLLASFHFYNKKVNQDAHKA